MMGASSARVRARKQARCAIGRGGQYQLDEPLGPVDGIGRQGDNEPDLGRPGHSARPGPASMRFANRSTLTAMSRAEPMDDDRRTAVVRGELDATCLWVVEPEVEDAPHIGEAPCVDGLVVVANHEEVALRLGQEPHQLELRGVHVLELVDAHVGEARLPAAAADRVALERGDRFHDEVVEVAGTARCQQPGVQAEDWQGDLRWPSSLDLGRGEPGVQRGDPRQVRSVRGAPDQASAASGAQERQPVRHQLQARLALEQDLAGQRMERSDLHGLGSGERRGEPLRDPGA